VYAKVVELEVPAAGHTIEPEPLRSNLLTKAILFKVGLLKAQLAATVPFHITLTK